MNIYDYFNSKTIAEYWREHQIAPDTRDMLSIICHSNELRNWDEKRAALEKVMRMRKVTPTKDHKHKTLTDRHLTAQAPYNQLSSKPVGDCYG